MRTAGESLSLAENLQIPFRELANQYGYLKFDDSELSAITRLSQYIRLALDTNAKTVVEFMQRAWRLPTPDLIISVTGGGKQCNMSTHLRKTFQRGLVTAAATTSTERKFHSKDGVFFGTRGIDAWLITGGTNTGVIKEVGQALNNYRYKNRKHALDVPCIGIGSWRHTAGTEQLEQISRFSVNVNLENEISTANFSKPSMIEGAHTVGGPIASFLLRKSLALLFSRISRMNSAFVPTAFISRRRATGI